MSVLMYKMLKILAFLCVTQKARFTVSFVAAFFFFPVEQNIFSSRSFSVEYFFLPASIKFGFEQCKG